MKKEDVVRGIAWFVPQHYIVMRSYIDFRQDMKVKP